MQLLQNLCLRDLIAWSKSSKSCRRLQATRDWLPEPSVIARSDRRQPARCDDYRIRLGAACRGTMLITISEELTQGDDWTLQWLPCGVQRCSPNTAIAMESSLLGLTEGNSILQLDSPAVDQAMHSGGLI